jgi:hypothetical protein
MLSSRHRLPYWQIAALAAFAALWIALSVPLVFGQGDAEAYLLSAFKNSVQADAFVRLNQTFLLMWIAHSCLLVLGIVAVVARTRDLFTVLVIGPLLAFLVGLFSQQWSDPDWSLFAGVCFVGWAVSVLAGGVYCVYWLCVRPVEPRDAMDPADRKVSGGPTPGH